MSIDVLLQALASGLAVGGVYALVALGLSLIFGVLRIVNFAHGEFVMLGMLITYGAVAWVGLPLPVACLISCVLLAIVGAAFERFAVERTLGHDEDVQILLTVGLGALIQGTCVLLIPPGFRILMLPGLEGAIDLGVVSVSKAKVVACIASVFIALSMFTFLKYTAVGKKIRACADNPLAAELVGIPVARFRMLTFSIGIALVGIAGSLVMPFLHVAPHVGAMFTLKAFVIVVLAGMGRLGGTLAAGVAVGIVEGISAAVFSDSVKEAPVFLLFLIVLYVRPNGLFNEAGQ